LYSTVFAVKTLVETDKSDSEIVNIIKQADAYIDIMLGGTVAPADYLKSWSSRMTAFYIQSMGNVSGITGGSTSNVSRIKIGDAEIQKEIGVNTSSSSSSSSGVRLDWRGQVTEEIRTYIRMCKRG
jgi:hypothetical protein